MTYEAHLTRDQIVKELKSLRQVWEDTKNANEILIDVCNTFAGAMGIRGEHHDKFMEDCGWHRVWG